MTETPVFQSFRAAGLFENARRGLSHGIVSPLQARPGDLIGAQMIVSRDETETLTVFAAWRFLVAGEDGPRLHAFPELNEIAQHKAAMVAAWLNADDLDQGWQIDWAPGHAGVSYTQSFVLTLLPEMAFLKRQWGDTSALKMHLYRGRLQEALDYEWRLLLPNPASAHARMHSAAAFTGAGRRAHEEIARYLLRTSDAEEDITREGGAALPPLEALGPIPA